MEWSTPTSSTTNTPVQQDLPLLAVRDPRMVAVDDLHHPEDRPDPGSRADRR